MSRPRSEEACAAPPTGSRWRALLALAGQILQRTLGAPDYAAYVAHRRAHHPGEALLNREDFFRDRLAARYRRGSTRCC